MNKIYTLLFITVFNVYFSSAQTSQLWGMTSAGGGTDSGGTMFNFTLGDSGVNVLHIFNTLTGIQPNGSLIQASNGLYYGLAEYGGANNAGVLFDYDPGSNTYSDVFDFDYSTNGGYPTGNLLMVNDTTLFGMTSGGGSNGDGTIFSFNPTTNMFTHLYDLTDSGSVPMGSLIKASDGNLYGLTSGGGINSGTIFRYNIRLDSLFNLYAFTTFTGIVPDGSLLQARNGLLYGMASGGGANSDGVIFSFNLTDSVYTDVHDFNNTKGANPYGSLIQASDSLLYGMTYAGGADSLGVIFYFDTKTNAYHDLYDFNGTGGADPYGDLVQSGTNGKLYGMTQFGGADSAGVLFSFDPSNSNFVDFVDFKNSIGQFPTGNLIEVFVTGIPVLTNNTGIQLYPNPAFNELEIKSENLRIEQIDIYNVLGQKAYISQSGIQNPTAETSINVSTLSEGVYFVHVLFAAANSQTQEVWVGKFVKGGKP